jgi:hypothetical protein
VQFFAGLKANGFARSDADFSACSWIAADAGFARANAKDTKAAQLDAIACGEGLLQSFEYSIDGYFCFRAR